MTSQEAKTTEAARDRLKALEVWLCLALALTLHISLTAAWVVLILATLVTLFRPDAPGRFKMLGRAPLMVPLAVFALAVILSTLVNGGLADSKQIFTNLRSFLVYFYIYQAFGTLEKCSQKTLAVFLCVGALAGLYGAVQYIFNFHPFTYPYLQATGFLQAPMPFAGVMQLTNFLGLGLLRRGAFSEIGGLLGRREIFLAVVAANFIGLIFSLERSAWLGMMAGLLSLALAAPPKKLWLWGLGAMVVLVMSWFCVPAVKSRVTALTNWKTDVSVTTRIEVWSRSLELFKQHPILGVGPSHFPLMTDMQEALVPGHSTSINHAHSNYMQMLATLGLVGLGSFLLLVFWSLAVTFAAGRGTGWNGGVGLGTFAALVSLAVAGLFEYNFGAGQVKLAQWFLLGAVGAGQNAAFKEIESSKKQD